MTDEDKTYKQWLINSKELKRLVLARLTEIGQNAFSVCAIIGINRRDLSTWIYYHTTNYDPKWVDITTNKIYILCDALGIHIHQKPGEQHMQYMITLKSLEFVTIPIYPQYVHYVTDPETGNFVVAGV